MENGVLLRNSTSMMYSARCFRCFCENPELCGALCAQVTVVNEKTGSEEPAFLIFYSGQHFVFSHLCQLSVLFIECPERFKTADDLTAGI